MKKGKLIVIDGADGSGKATQAKLLINRLKKENIATRLVDFPQYYDTFFGKMVGEYLTGEYGDPLKISPYLSSQLYAGDRWQASDDIKKALANGEIVIANRYVSSSAAHQSANITPLKRAKFTKWLYKLEYEIYQIPHEDMLIYLDVPVSISTKLIAKRNSKSYMKGRVKDKFEASKVHLENASRMYKKLIKEHSNGYHITCVKDGKLLSPEAIHDEVWQIVSNLI